MNFSLNVIKQRLADVESAIGSQRLEGLEPDHQTVTDLKAQARGEIDISEVLNRTLARIKCGEL